MQRAVLILVCSACSSATVDTLPLDVNWVAFLGSDGVGTPFSPVDHADPPALPDSDAETIFVYGYSSAAIEAANAPGDQIRTDAIFAAKACDLALPDPTVALSYVDGETEGIVESPAPISAAWRSAACADLPVERITVDDTCAWDHCERPPTADGCCVRVDLTDCGIGEFAFASDDEGALSLIEADTGCTGRLGPEGSIAGFACDEPLICRGDVYIAPQESGLAVDSVRLLDVSPRFGSEDGRLGTTAIRRGFLGDMIFLGDHLIISSYGGEWFNEICQSTEEAEVVYIDPDSLDVVQRVLAPPCVSKLAARVDAPGFIGAAGVAPNVALYAFDTDGTVTSSVPIPLELVQDHRNMHITEIFVSTDPPGYFAIVNPTLHDVDVLVRYDFQLNLVASLVLVQSEVRRIVQSAPGELLFLDDKLNGLRTYDVETNTLIEEFIGPFGGATRLSDLKQSLQTYNLFLAAAGITGAVHIVGPDRSNSRAKPLGIRASPTVITDWLGDTWIASVTGDESQAWASRASLVDTDYGRFLPGGVELPPGPASKAVARGPEEAFFLMNWSAEVVRVRRSP